MIDNIRIIISIIINADNMYINNNNFNNNFNDGNNNYNINIKMNTLFYLFNGTNISFLIESTL
jgi:hypothetical protein